MISLSHFTIHFSHEPKWRNMLSSCTHSLEKEIHKHRYSIQFYLNVNNNYKQAKAVAHAFESKFGHFRILIRCENMKLLDPT